jgi:hypothetical protein
MDCTCMLGVTGFDCWSRFPLNSQYAAATGGAPRAGINTALHLDSSRLTGSEVPWEGLSSLRILQLKDP